MTDATDCTCYSVKEAFTRTLNGEPLEPCPEHDPPDTVASTPLALNDDVGLAAVIGAALANPTHENH